MARTVRPVKKDADVGRPTKSFRACTWLVRRIQAHTTGAFTCAARRAWETAAPQLTQWPVMASGRGKVARKAAMYTNGPQRGADVTDISAGRRIRADRG